MEANITHMAALGRSSAAAKFRSTWKPMAKGRPIASMATKMPA